MPTLPFQSKPRKSNLFFLWLLSPATWTPRTEFSSHQPVSAQLRTEPSPAAGTGCAVRYTVLLLSSLHFTGVRQSVSCIFHQCSKRTHSLSFPHELCFYNYNYYVIIHGFVSNLWQETSTQSNCRASDCHCHNSPSSLLISPRNSVSQHFYERGSLRQKSFHV